MTSRRRSYEDQLNDALDEVAASSMPGGEAIRGDLRRVIEVRRDERDAEQDRAVFEVLDDGDRDDPRLVAVAAHVGDGEAVERWGRELKRHVSAFTDPDVLALALGALATVGAERGDWQRAERQHMEALALTPDVVDYSLWLAEGLLARSRIEEAKSVLLDALAIHPDEERLHVLLAQTLPDSTSKVSWRYSR
jgi:tetratricopeptide (TPR) repeat protein